MLPFVFDFLVVIFSNGKSSTTSTTKDLGVGWNVATERWLLIAIYLIREKQTTKSLEECVLLFFACVLPQVADNQKQLGKMVKDFHGIAVPGLNVESK